MNTAEEQEAVKIEKKQSYFEMQRDELIGENLEQVLQALNQLNRGLEGVIAVGNELSSVEALWTQFESVMTQRPDSSSEQAGVENAH